MKKLLFVFTALILFACSSSDDNSNTSQNPISINPPDWIQGTWIQDGITGTSFSMGFKFSSNDLCALISTTEQCQQGLIDLTRKSGQPSTV